METIGTIGNDTRTDSNACKTGYSNENTVNLTNNMNDTRALLVRRILDDSSTSTKSTRKDRTDTASDKNVSKKGIQF